MPGTEKMKHVSLTLQVENDLKHQLSIGALKPGARLITKNLAEQFGMSITPRQKHYVWFPVNAPSRNSVKHGVRRGNVDDEINDPCY
ncbi:hypothetical protein DJICPGNB_05400 [Escherichia coli]|nr:hypothetical protein DJICPGNB_05400 [Escherichia coli]